jgi:hypothetical protein
MSRDLGVVEVGSFELATGCGHRITQKIVINDQMEPSSPAEATLVTRCRDGKRVVDGG